MCQLEKARGKRSPLLDELRPPESAQFAWSVYFSKLRGTNVSMSDIKAYCDLYNVSLAPWEIDIILIIHKTIENYLNEQMNKRTNQAPKPSSPRRR